MLETKNPLRFEFERWTRANGYKFDFKRTVIAEDNPTHIYADTKCQDLWIAFTGGYALRRFFKSKHDKKRVKLI